jgi:hypothetical protein
MFDYILVLLFSLLRCAFLSFPCFGCPTPCSFKQRISVHKHLFINMSSRKSKSTEDRVPLVAPTVTIPLALLPEPSLCGIKWRTINVIVLGVCFLLLFSAFNPSQVCVKQPQMRLQRLLLVWKSCRRSFLWPFTSCLVNFSTPVGPFKILRYCVCFLVVYRQFYRFFLTDVFHFHFRRATNQQPTKQLDRLV